METPKCSLSRSCFKVSQCIHFGDTPKATAMTAIPKFEIISSMLEDQIANDKELPDQFSLLKETEQEYTQSMHRKRQGSNKWI